MQSYCHRSSREMYLLNSKNAVSFLDTVDSDDCLCGLLRFPLAAKLDITSTPQIRSGCNAANYQG